MLKVSPYGWIDVELTFLVHPELLFLQDRRYLLFGDGMQFISGLHRLVLLENSRSRIDLWLQRKG